MKIVYPNMYVLLAMLDMKSSTKVMDEAYELIPADATADGNTKTYTITTECKTIEGDDVYVTMYYIKDKSQDNAMTVAKYMFEMLVEVEL